MRVISSIVITFFCLQTFPIETKETSQCHFSLIENILDFWFLEEVGTPEVSDENIEFILGIKRELDFTGNLHIRKMTPSTQYIHGKKNALSVGYYLANYIFISEEWFNKLTSDKKRALIGHEIMHLKRYHTLKRLALVHVIQCIKIYFLAKYLLPVARTGENVIRYNGKCREYDLSYNPLSIIKNLRDLPEILKDPDACLIDKSQLNLRKAFIFLTIMTMFSLASSLIIRYVRRKFEKEADILSAIKLRSTQGLIALAEEWDKEKSKNEDPSSRFWLRRLLYENAFVKWWARLFYTHPDAKERIAYLKILAESQKAA